ncbi:MAG: histidine--tRNA ligase [Fusobacteria bacterium]|nr:histidine--tRNA ligase [Fusobacteriota bacterium]
MKITGPKGTHDILYKNIYKWQFIESQLKNLVELYDYQEMRTPIFENTDLFLRGVGDTTDIVDKEMYTFKDKGDRSITLRPEGTAGVVRSFIEHSCYNEVLPGKFYYYGPMFRYSRPQAGRYRQFHQFGVEALGSADPFLDGEVLELMMNMFKALGLKQLKLEINSVGCPVCRPIHKEKLKDYLKSHYDQLCPTCQSRYEKNPLRIFDCKSLTCQEIIQKGPYVTDNLCDDCENHFIKVKEYLDMVELEYEVNKKMVRGLDYYTKTAFEVSAGREGSQSSIGGGGRYDGLVEELGGPELSGIGFAIGLERIVMTMDEQMLFEGKFESVNKVFIASVSSNEIPETVRLVSLLRKNDIHALRDTMNRKLKAQFKYANKIGADYVITIGDEEVSSKIYTLKNMKTSKEESYVESDLINILKGENNEFKK